MTTPANSARLGKLGKRRFSDPEISLDDIVFNPVGPHTFYSKRKKEKDRELKKSKRERLKFVISQMHPDDKQKIVLRKKLTSLRSSFQEIEEGEMIVRA